MSLSEYPLQSPILDGRRGIVAFRHESQSVFPNDVARKGEPCSLDVQRPCAARRQRDDVFLMNTLHRCAGDRVARRRGPAGSRRATDRRRSTDEEREALATLTENGFVVREPRGRTRRSSSSISATSSDGHDQLRVTVLTTLQCNFACDYCFQGDHGDYNKFADEDDAGNGGARRRVDRARLDTRAAGEASC